MFTNTHKILHNQITCKLYVIHETSPFCSPTDLCGTNWLINAPKSSDKVLSGLLGELHPKPKLNIFYVLPQNFQYGSWSKFFKN